MRTNTRKSVGAGTGRIADDVEAYMQDHPEKRTKLRDPAPLRVVLTQSEKDRRAVLRAIGHDVDGKCPTGLDWQNLSGGPYSPIFGILRELQSARGAAKMRVSSWLSQLGTPGERESEDLRPALDILHAARMRMISWLNHLGASGEKESEQKSAACGWWFCEQKDRLKAEQWADLRAALDILRKAGIDPNSQSVSGKAAMCAEMTVRARQWNTIYKHLSNYVDANPASVESMQGSAIDNLRAMELSEWAKGPKGVGRPVSAPYHRFLNEYAERGPTVAAAIWVLFGLGKAGRRLKAEIHRAQEAWDLGGELNSRAKPKIR